jgi:hypothetical protein
MLRHRETLSIAREPKAAPALWCVFTGGVSVIGSSYTSVPAARKPQLGNQEDTT